MTASLVPQRFGQRLPISAPNAVGLEEGRLAGALGMISAKAIACKDLWCGHHVRIVDGTTVTQAKPRKLMGDFFAFPGEEATRLRNGIYVAAGDLNGDGRDELVFGAGPGGGPRVLVLDSRLVVENITRARLSPMADFFAFDSNSRGGVPVAVNDIDGDDVGDLVAANGSAFAFHSGAIANWSGGNPGSGVTLRSANMMIRSADVDAAGIGGVERVELFDRSQRPADVDADPCGCACTICRDNLFGTVAVDIL